MALAGCAADKPWPRPLFDCKGVSDRYLLRSLEDGMLVLEIDSPPKGKVGVSTWLHAWTDVRTGWVGGQQGGHQSHVRLNDGQRNYVLYEGEDGSLAERPGRTCAGVVVVGRDDIGNIEVVADCEASGTNRALLDNLRKMRDAAGQPDLPEEVENGPFDAWF